MRYDGVPAAELAGRLGAPSCLVLPRVSSTLDLVHELAAEGAPAGAVVLADEQIAGRGRLGRRWHSPAGQGIWLGVLHRTRAAGSVQLASLRVGLAIVRALASLGVTMALKWPNDLLWQGRKLGGILCEARWRGEDVRWVAVGVGINVHGPLPADLADRAAVLDEAAPEVSRIAALGRIVPALRELPDSDGLSHEELDQYAACDWLRGRKLREPVEGTARGLSMDGALLVETMHGTERVIGGSVVTV
jgi:BirA family biotin operon repressor/biotin-[acetyl-CoA-carboxylase] ligase